MPNALGIYNQSVAISEKFINGKIEAKCCCFADPLFKKLCMHLRVKTGIANDRCHVFDDSLISPIVNLNFCS